MTAFCCVHDNDITARTKDFFGLIHSSSTIHCALYYIECTIIYFVHAQFKSVYQKWPLWPMDDLKKTIFVCRCVCEEENKEGGLVFEMSPSLYWDAFPFNCLFIRNVSVFYYLGASQTTCPHPPRVPNSWLNSSCGLSASSVSCLWLSP